LFHLVLVSEDLSVFRHEHPEIQADGSLLHRTVLPKGGMYRVLCDFYPEGGTPQMIAKTMFLSGASPVVPIKVDLSPQSAESVNRAIPWRMGSLACRKFGSHRYDPHASSLGGGGPTVQFNLIFPRPGIYRVWAQFQRRGVVNTAAFNVPVAAL
jgi:hypothetical protein